MASMNFPGYVNVLGRQRSATTLGVATVGTGLAVGGGAGALAHVVDRDSSPVKKVAIGLAAGGVGAAAAGVAVLARGKGAQIGRAFGQNSYQHKIGEHTEMQLVPISVPAGKTPTTTMVFRPVTVTDYETRWAKAEGRLHLNALKGELTSRKEAEKTARDQMARGREVAVLQDGDRFQAATTKSGGLEVTERVEPTDPRVVRFTNGKGRLHRA